MPGVPAFILRRLYVKGSLTNAENGWSFTLRNSLGSGHANGLIPLKLDETTEIPMRLTSFVSDRTLVTFDQVSEDNTFGLKMNKEIVINITGDRLTPGEHSIYFACIVPGLGKIGFDFVDVIADD
jgi:hypothetical protein